MSLGGPIGAGAYQDSRLAVSDASTGISRRGMLDYVEKVNIEVIEKTIQKLNKTEDIVSAVNSAWAGKSKVAFLNALDASITKIIEDLKAEQKDMSHRFQDLQFSYLKQDEELANDINSQF